MGRWLLLLGGLIVWLVHFLGVYAIASIAAVAAGQADAPLALWAVVGFSLICAGADLALLAIALPRLRRADDSLDRFIAGGAALGAGLSLLAVIWQGLPVMVAG
jgi:hypothetical protein